MAVPGRLDEPEEDLLEGTGIALDVGERWIGDVEILCGLDDADLGIGEVWHGLVEKFRTHGKIGVNYRDEVSVADAKGMQEVAGLLQLAWVGSHDVPEVVPVCKVSDFLPSRIIQHVDGLEPVPAHFADVSKRVVQHG